LGSFFELILHLRKYPARNPSTKTLKEYQSSSGLEKRCCFTVVFLYQIRAPTKIPLQKVSVRISRNQTQPALPLK
jgi:hypothetical protein